MTASELDEGPAPRRPFLVRIGGFRDVPAEVVQAPALMVTWREVHRTKKETPLYREIEHDHWDKSGLTVAPVPTSIGSIDDPNPAEILNARGLKHRTERRTIDRSSPALRKVLRRIRPGDAEDLAHQDALIAAAVAVVDRLRAERVELVELAWKRGEDVRTWDVEPQGDEHRRVVR